MTSPEYPEDDASLEFKVEQIKRRYKRRSDEIAQKLTAAEKQLSDTRMVMKHLQENCIPPDVDTRTYITQLLQNEKQRKDQQQLNFAFLPSPAPPYPPHPEDTGKFWFLIVPHPSCYEYFKSACQFRSYVLLTTLSKKNHAC